MSGMPLRGDRIHRYVNAFCPVCHEERPDRPLAEVQRLSGWLVERDGRIWLERGCATPRPGPHAVRRVARDPALPRAVDGADQAPRARRARQLQAGARGLRRRPARDADPAHLHPARGPPRPLQPQVPDLLRRVLAGAGVGGAAEQVLASIDTRLSRENQRIDVLMLSGGEPTLYPWLAELLDEVAARPIVRVLVNTNGLRIAQDDELLALLTRHRERVEVYLQYDGESAEASTYHRGADIRRFKERAIERLSAQRHLHHAHHDRRPRRQRRRDRQGGQAGPRHAVRRRGHHPAGVRQRPVRRDRPARPAHPHRRARPAGGADGRRGHLARPDGAAVLAPALLLGRLPAARRLRAPGSR